MSIMAWATVSKFVLDSLFYQVADAQFGSARQIAALCQCYDDHDFMCFR